MIYCLVEIHTSVDAPHPLSLVHPKHCSVSEQLPIKCLAQGRPGLIGTLPHSVSPQSVTHQAVTK